MDCRHGPLSVIQREVLLLLFFHHKYLKMIINIFENSTDFPSDCFLFGTWLPCGNQKLKIESLTSGRAESG